MIACYYTVEPIPDFLRISDQSINQSPRPDQSLIYRSIYRLLSLASGLFTAVFSGFYSIFSRESVLIRISRARIFGRFQVSYHQHLTSSGNDHII